MDFFKECAQVGRSYFHNIFHKLTKRFVDKRFGNAWQLAMNKIHETLKMFICNSRKASLGATIIKKQSVKKLCELSDDRVGPKTTKHVQ